MVLLMIGCKYMVLLMIGYKYMVLTRPVKRKEKFNVVTIYVH